MHVYSVYWPAKGMGSSANTSIQRMRDRALEVDLDPHLDESRRDLHRCRTSEVRVREVGIDAAEQSAVENVRRIRTHFDVEGLLTGAHEYALHQRQAFLIDRRRPQFVQVGSRRSEL